MVDVPAQLDALVAEYDEIRAETPHDDLSGGDRASKLRAERLCIRVMAACERLLPEDSVYAQQAQNAISRHPRSGQLRNPGGTILRQFEALRAFVEDADAGMLSLEATIRGAVFADFLEMADHVLSEIHRTPAAVIAGFTLEEHLRKMCSARGIPTTRGDGTAEKADTLNGALANDGAYSERGKTETKDVTAWLGRRNDAAHGHHDRYSDEDVALMIEGVRGFVSRHPA